MAMQSRRKLPMISEMQADDAVLHGILVFAALCHVIDGRPSRRKDPQSSSDEWSLRGPRTAWCREKPDRGDAPGRDAHEKELRVDDLAR